MDKVYHIELDDYSTPAFVSFGKNYYGRMADVEEFISKFEDDEDNELVRAFQEYKDGNKDAEITVAYTKRKMLEEVKVYGSKEINSGSFEWEHTNIWGFPYYLRCESLNSFHFWIKSGVILYRVIKAKFTNLQYKNAIGEWSDINSIWGFPHIIEFGMYNTLMVVEKSLIQLWNSKRICRISTLSRKWILHHFVMIFSVMDDLIKKVRWFYDLCAFRYTRKRN